jgi:hypothetical protein
MLTRIGTASITARKCRWPRLARVERRESNHRCEVVEVGVVKGEVAVEEKVRNLQGRERLVADCDEASLAVQTRVPTAQMSAAPAGLAQSASKTCSGGDDDKAP